MQPPQERCQTRRSVRPVNSPINQFNSDATARRRAASSASSPRLRIFSSASARAPLSTMRSRSVATVRHILSQRAEAQGASPELGGFSLLQVLSARLAGDLGITEPRGVHKFVCRLGRAGGGPETCLARAGV